MTTLAAPISNPWATLTAAWSRLLPARNTRDATTDDADETRQNRNAICAMMRDHPEVFTCEADVQHMMLICQSRR